MHHLVQVHDALGFTHCQKYGFAIGAAAVSPETVKFFLSLDMKLLEMISMTEMTAFVQLTNTPEPGEFRVGKVGREGWGSCVIGLWVAGVDSAEERTLFHSPCLGLNAKCGRKNTTNLTTRIVGSALPSFGIIFG